MRRVEFVVLDLTSRQQAARGAINGEPIVLDPGEYLVQLTGVDSEAVAVNLGEGTLVEGVLADEGKLQFPALHGREK